MRANEKKGVKGGEREADVQTEMVQNIEINTDGKKEQSKINAK